MLSQIIKILQISSEFGLTDAKESAVSKHTDYLNITGDENLLPSNDQYRQTVEALLYVAATTRPDIAATVSILCRRVNSPCRCDLNAAPQVIRYLKGTI